MVQIKQKRGIGVERSSPRSVSGGLLSPAQTFMFPCLIWLSRACAFSLSPFLSHPPFFSPSLPPSLPSSYPPSLLYLPPPSLPPSLLPSLSPSLPLFSLPLSSLFPSHVPKIPQCAAPAARGNSPCATHKEFLWIVFPKTNQYYTGIWALVFRAKYTELLVSFQ